MILCLMWCISIISCSSKFYSETKEFTLQGDAEAQYTLGLMYCNGEGVSKDLSKAKIWIKKAYDNGDSTASKAWEKYELWKY